ncbi:MAG TPA: IS1380 family transposase [Epsilonproteobacteria bacterium]|nr:IS1380 family transposase [Campylobacterota bacterium]
MTQNVLNFTVESTDERLTPRSGEIIFGEYLKAIGLEKLCNNYLPQSGSNRGFSPFTFIQPLLLMLHSGGRSLDDLRLIQTDKAMQEILHMDNIPTADATGKWLKRHGLMGVYGMEHINRVFLKHYLKRVDEPLVLDIDASVIESHKATAAYTYKMFPGFTPMIGHINGGYIIHNEFRSGNIAPADYNLSFVARCIEQLPKTQTLKFLRADSASYQHKLFDYCEEHNITYTIGAHLDSAVLENINEIQEWERMTLKQGTTHRIKEEVAEFIHVMNNSDNAFRLIVVKKQITPMLPTLEEILSVEEKLKYAKEHYSVIATNADESMSAQDVVKFYRKRGDTSENRIKELKNGFNLKYLPTSDFTGNAFYFQVGVLAYNLFVLFKETLQKSWQRHTIQTLRYKLYNIAGKVITHARKTILKVNEQFTNLLNDIRQKNYEINLQ